MRPVPPDLVDDEEQAFVYNPILDKAMVTDVVADSLRSVGDLVERAGGGELDEVGRGELGGVGELGAVMAEEAAGVLLDGEGERFPVRL